MKLRDLLKVMSDECVNKMQVYVKTELHDIMQLDYDRVYVGDIDDREVLARYLDYFVVCVDDNFIITIKGHKIA